MCDARSHSHIYFFLFDLTFYVSEYTFISFDVGSHIHLSLLTFIFDKCGLCVCGPVIANKFQCKCNLS